MVKFGNAPPDAVVKLYPMLVKLPGAKPAAVNSAAVYSICVLLALPPPARKGEPSCTLDVAVAVGAVPADAAMLDPDSDVTPPWQMLGGLAVTAVMIGFAFTVTTTVAVLAQPATPLSSADNVIV